MVPGGIIDYERVIYPPGDHNYLVRGQNISHRTTIISGKGFPPLWCLSTLYPKGSCR